jgi:hypothetical protein
LRAGFLNNQFQTDPPQTEPVVRHPYAIGLETSVTDRLAVEASISEGIGLGLKVNLLSEVDGPTDLAIGIDELLFPVESHLFGRDSQNLTWVPGRAWISAAQTWEFLRARGAVTASPTTDGFEFVPKFALETAFKWPVALGWEASWEDATFRNSLGLSVQIKDLELAGGLSEFQSWIYRKGAFGFFNDPPSGATDGIGNPGWWFSVKWDLPRLRAVQPAPMPVVKCPATVFDANALQPVVDLLQQRMLRADVAELAMRAESEGTVDPVAMAVLRRRILAGGASARQALWRIALDETGPLGERKQAAVTLSDEPRESDLSGLDGLSQDPASSLRLEAAMALGRLNGSGAIRILTSLARDPEEMVRLAAKSALQTAATREK